LKSASHSTPAHHPTPAAAELRGAALEILLECDPIRKMERVRALAANMHPIDARRILAAPGGALPGRPARPLLVDARHLAARPVTTLAGRAALIHALTHIEFNAVNLSLDACWRFAAMPEAFYRDWLRVAGEEAHHFTLLSAHLRVLGHEYGDLPAHNGLWDMVQKTSDDVLARMALVPRTLEARGLDAAPPMREKLAAAGDHQAAAILDILLRDEIGHVAIGNHWYRWLCAQRRLDPVREFEHLSTEYGAPRSRGPFNLEARRQAGFDDDELIALTLR
jgi:uncharacterized ferritin-like protein (DUF455 family)